jgi:hypothetical protein
MRKRIAIWAGAGLVVAAFWVLYAFAASPESIPGLRVLAGITCPITLASHFPIGLSWVLITNAATYALVGLIVETLRKRRKQTHNHGI